MFNISTSDFNLLEKYETLLSVQDFYLLQLCFLKLTGTHLPTIFRDFFISNESIKIYELFTKSVREGKPGEKCLKINHSGIEMFVSLPDKFLLNFRKVCGIDRLAFIINRIHPTFGIFEGKELLEDGLYTPTVPIYRIYTMHFIKDPFYYYSCIGLLTSVNTISSHKLKIGDRRFCPEFNWYTISKHFVDLKKLLKYSAKYEYYIQWDIISKRIDIETLAICMEYDCSSVLGNNLDWSIITKRLATPEIIIKYPSVMIFWVPSIIYKRNLFKGFEFEERHRPYLGFNKNCLYYMLRAEEMDKFTAFKKNKSSKI